MKNSSVPPPSARPPQLSSAFYLVFIAGLLSDVGTFISQTALFLHVYKLSGQNTSYVGLMAMAEILPIVLITPIGGVLAERHNRKWIMVGNDLVRIPLILLMITTSRPLVLIALQWLVSASTALFSPSRQSMLPDIVPPERIELANSMVSGVRSVVHVLGPALGALIYSYTHTLTAVMAVDAASYLLSALLLMGLHISAPLSHEAAKEDASDGFWADLGAGLRYLRKAPDLRILLLICLIGGMATGLSAPLFRPFIDEVLHGDDKLYSYMLVAFGIGGLLGPFLGYLLGRRLGLGRAVLWLALVDAVFMMVFSRVEHAGLSLALVLGWGLNEFAIVPCQTSYIHQFAKKELMGRTFALFEFAENLPQIIAALIISVIGNRLPSQSILTTASVGYVVAIGLAMCSRSGRLVSSRRGQPDLMTLID